MSDELWTIRGNKPVLWTVPFRAVWRGREAEFFCALPLFPKQQRAVNELMASVARPFNGMWMITRSALKRVGELMSEGMDPEDCFSWERPRKAMRPEFRPEMRFERDAFLDALYQRGVGRSRDEVEYWWYQICNHALDWLINQERCVDMYFVRLQPSPYRVDWLQRVREDARRHRTLKRFDPNPIKLRLHREFLKRLKEPNLLAFDPKRGTCERQVEIQHTAVWRRNIRRVEEERLKMLGPCGYADMVVESAEQRIRDSILIFSSYVRGSRTASCRICPGKLAGSFQFEKRGKRSKAPLGELSQLPAKMGEQRESRKSNVMPPRVRVAVPDRFVADSEFIDSMRSQGAVVLTKSYLHHVPGLRAHFKGAGVINLASGAVLVTQPILESGISRVTRELDRVASMKAGLGKKVSEVCKLCSALAYLAGKMTNSQRRIVEMLRGTDV